jgi:hypothetical protein
MTYYQDLTPYEYFLRHEPIGIVPINIGWLSIGFPFSTGETSQTFKEILLEHCSGDLVHIARGLHVCELCYPSESQWFDEHRFKPSRENIEQTCAGTGEIRLIGKTAIYAAPTLIYHYVTKHNYKPPEEFIEAILNGPRPNSESHRELLAKYREKSENNVAEIKARLFAKAKG